MPGQEEGKAEIITEIKQMSIRVDESASAQNKIGTPRKLSQLEAGYIEIVGKSKTCRSIKILSLSVFRDGFEVRRSSIISLGLVILSLSICVTFSEAYNSGNDNPLKSTVLPGKLLKTAIVPNYYPYSFVDDKGMPDGFSVDVAKAVVQVMDMKLEISADTWEHAREALENGTIDFLPMMASSPLRRQSFDFSAPHTIAYDAIFVRRGTTKIGSLNDLAGKTIIVMNKDAAHDFILTTSVSNTIKLILVDSLPDGLRLLASGKGDAAIMPKMVGLLLAKKLNVTNIEESPVTIESYNRPFSFAVKKGNTALLERLSQGLSIVDATGQYHAIYDKWLGVLAPPGLPWKSVVKYIAGIVVAFGLVGMVLLVWSLSLRKLVTQRTKTLESEILVRKKTEAALRESEERFRLSMEATDDGIWDWDTKTDEVYRSPTFYRMLGYDQAEFPLGFDGWKSLVHPDDVDEAILSLTDYLTGKAESYQTEFRMFNKSGELVWILSRGKVVARDDYGKPLRMVGTHVDVTYRKQAEEALRREQIFTGALLENMVDGVVACDADFKLVLFNRTAREWHDLDPMAVPAEKWAEYYDLYCADGITPMTVDTVPLARAFRGEVLRNEGMLIRAKGQPAHHILANCAPFFDEKGTKLGAVGVMHDITDRKTAEEHLRKAEQRYRSLFEDAPLMYVITRNEQGVPFISDCNDLFLRSLGYTREEVVGQALADFYSPKSRADLLEDGGYRRALAGEFLMGERQLLALSGRLIPTLLYTAPEVDSSGGVIGTRAMFADITERKRAEEALRESEERYRAVFDNAAVGINLSDLEGRFIKVNSTSARMLGYTQEELAELTFYDLTHPEDRKPSRENLLALQQGEKDSYRFEKRYIRKDGQAIWADISVSALRDAKGEYTSTLGVVIDITKRKRAEEALSKQAEFMTHLMEAIPLPVFFKDVNHTYVGCNNAFAEFLGLPKERIVGKPVFEVVSHETAEIFKEYDETLFGNPGTQVYATSVKRFDGSAREVIFHKATYGDPDGLVSGLIGVILDITDRKILEQQLLQAQKMEAIGTLAGGIAHDFNNLLQVTLGYSELLLAEKREDDPEYGDLSKIFQAARSGAELVQRMLTFSRKVEPKPVPLNLNRRILQVEKLLRRTIPKMIYIQMDLHDDLAEINADPTQMEQVLMNLAVNARDAMPDGGNLTISTRNVSLDEEYCRVHAGIKPGEHVLLMVSDTGHGMHKAAIDHIFEPFYTTKELGRGTGLGLAMVYGIVKQHEGFVNCYSEVGHGTTFNIYFPAIESQVELEVEKTGVMPAFGTETILLVDDEEFVRDLGARILSKAGYNVLTATNGREALDLFEKERTQISLVILDLIMPEMGGKECLKELIKVAPQLKVLIASGLSADPSTKESVEMGTRGFVSKPFRMKELLRQVRKVLDEI
jgi:two-component system, cell cycle sensor histidine kinase and response regulator CckA